jgi:biopolymer transport protein ExbB
MRAREEATGGHRMPRRVPAMAALLAIAAAIVLGGGASAQGFDGAEKDVDQRLEQALRELGEGRDRIAKEKIPLSQEIAGLEEEVLALRRQRDELFKVRDSRSIDLDSLRKQVESLDAQDEFIESRLNEFVRDFEGRLHIAELPLYEEKTAAAKLADKNVNLAPEQQRAAQIAVVEAALGRLREQLGGQVFAGSALSPDGVLTPGKFVALGPTVFFASDDGAVSGLVESQLNAADPVVVALPGRFSSGIAELVANGKGELPLDATLGKAVKIEKAGETLGQHLAKGGAIGWVILALGLSALALAIFKVREIVVFRVAPPERIDGILDDLARGDQAAALEQTRGIAGAAGEMLTIGVEHAKEKREILEELLFEKLLEVRPALERFLPFLAITAAAAPLLGLLGTVTGMIKTFQLLTIFGTGDAKSLSSGISEALVTTELGLIVAIPALILHGALSRMAKHKLGVLEQLSMAFINGLETIRQKRQASA